MTAQQMVDDMNSLTTRSQDLTKVVRVTLRNRIRRRAQTVQAASTHLCQHAPGRYINPNPEYNHEAKPSIDAVLC